MGKSKQINGGKDGLFYSKLQQFRFGRTNAYGVCVCMCVLCTCDLSTQFNIFIRIDRCLIACFCHFYFFFLASLSLCANIFKTVASCDQQHISHNTSFSISRRLFRSLHVMTLLVLYRVEAFIFAAMQYNGEFDRVRNNIKYKIYGVKFGM